MLQITVPGFEYFDERTGCFGHTNATTLQLEHSLLSVSKWEQRWMIPFLGRQEKTRDQCIDYVRCMTLTPNVDPLVYKGLTNGNFDKINRYIEAPMTALKFNDHDNRQHHRETITSETIYYWMISLQIPFECQEWHLGRLLALIRLCNARNAPAKKKKNTMELMQNWSAINKARRAKLGTAG